MRKRCFPVLLLLMLASACTKEGGGVAGPHATIFMRDGTKYAGTIASSSTTQVTVTGDDNATHILAMKDVKSINYDDAPAAPAGSTAPAPPPASAPAPVASHDDHYHPTESAISTKTYDLPVGTQVAVRCEETIDSAKAAEGQTYAAEVAKD